ncbi:hypothetical protein GTQ99_18345 [Kineococcus sp. T13]|uniref:hypothetical protein n=1 Tax=Kineococcus vitellinus TaxID=2696565 RepID=UPI001412DF4F|nr:hypothetical protein [Kineococcus vitellinus]NAZ77366.1 hypothetical protein [Kineococcus vitellinus]
MAIDRVRQAALLRAPRASAQRLAVLWKRRRLRLEVEQLVAGHVGGLDPHQGVADGWRAQRRWSVLPTADGAVSVSVSVEHVAAAGSSFGGDSIEPDRSAPSSATFSERVARPDWEYGLLLELRTLLVQHGHGVGEVKTDWRLTGLRVDS